MRVDVNFDLRIRQALARQVETLKVSSFDPQRSKDLAARVSSVRERFGNGRPALINQDRIEAAVLKLIASVPGSLEPRERYALACALTQPTAALDGRALISEEKIVSGLLRYWETEGHAECLRTSIWMGLFRSYLQAAPGGATEQLRHLLRGTLAQAVTGAAGRSPRMLTAMRHQELLSGAPCEAYVKEILQGQRSKIDDLLSVMPPPATSWFWDDLASTVAAQIDELDKRTFTERICLLLSLSEHSQLGAHRDTILARVLDRYCRMLDSPPHERLLRYALQYWESPQLKSNHSWSLVDPDTKRVLCGWLASEDLEDFFRICSNDRARDDRRLKYWLRFKEQIDFCQIALSLPLEESGDAAIDELVSRKKGRLARLIDSATEPSALLMKIGELVFVEFSRVGGACYPYRIEHLPFDATGRAYVEGVLKSEAAMSKSRTGLLRREEWWESEFDARLREWGVYPDSQGDRSLDAFAPADSLPTPRRLEPRPHVDALPHTFVQAIVATGATVEDLRSEGGSLWIYPGASTEVLDRELRELGFKLQAGRGYRRG